VRKCRRRPYWSCCVHVHVHLIQSRLRFLGACQPVYRPCHHPTNTLLTACLLRRLSRVRPSVRFRFIISFYKWILQKYIGSLQGLWIQNSRIYIISVLQHDLRASNWTDIDLQRTPLWSSSQSFWLQIQTSRVRFPALPDFLRSRRSGTRVHSASCEDNWGATRVKK
jgi:hypothetical protein